MNTGGSTGTGGDGLYVHWTKAKNERVDVLEARGISAPNLRQQVRRLTALAANTNIKAPIFHFWFPPNPSDRQPTRAELDSLLDRMEAEFNLKNTARIGVRHTLSRNMNDAERGKSWGRPMDSGDVLEDIAPDPAAQRHASWDGIDTHEHYAYLGIDEHGRALDHLRFSRIRRERVIVEWQVAHGFKITPMRHITAVLADLDVRNPEAARAMRDAGFLERRRAASDPAGIDPQPGPGIDTGSPSAIAMYGSGERAQMDRAADVGPSGKTRHAFNVRKDVLAAWKSSDTGDSFRVALEDRGYRLLMGSTSPVVVDPAGIVVRATEIIGTASRKLDGKGIPAADVHERLKGMDLTPLDDARAEHADPAGVAKGGAVVRDTPEPVTSGASRAEPTDNIYKETDHAYDAHATDARAPGETGPGGPQGGGRLGDIGGRGDEDRHVGDIGGFESGPVRDPDGGDFIEPKQRYAERDFGGKDGRRGADAGRPDRIGAGGRPHLLGRLRAAVGANRIKTAAALGIGRASSDRQASRLNSILERLGMLSHRNESAIEAADQQWRAARDSAVIRLTSVSLDNGWMSPAKAASVRAAYEKAEGDPARDDYAARLEAWVIPKVSAKAAETGRLMAERQKADDRAAALASASAEVERVREFSRQKSHPQRQAAWTAEIDGRIKAAAGAGHREALLFARALKDMGMPRIYGLPRDLCSDSEWREVYDREAAAWGTAANSGAEKDRRSGILALGMPDAWQPGAADLGAFWRTGESPTFRSLDAAAKALADPYIRRSARASAADIDAAVVRVKAYEAKAVQDYYAGQPRAQTPGFSGKIALPVTPEAVEAHQRAWMVHNIAQAKQAVRDQRKLVPLPVRVAHLEGITVEGRELLRRQKDLSELEEQHRVTDYPSISAVIAAANAQIVDAYEVKAKALMDRKRMAAAVIEGGCRSGNAGLVRMARNGQWEQAAVAAEKWRRAQGSGAVRELPALALTDGDTSYDLGAGVGQTI